MITPAHSFEEARGCGFRKDGGIYLVGGSGGDGCGKLPILLPQVCPTCGGGIKPSRAPRLVLDPVALWAHKPCTHAGDRVCRACPFSQASIGPALLLWVGEKFYPTPASYIEEARARGISRRIGAVPRGFKVGENYVILAHRKSFAVRPVDDHSQAQEEIAWLPGIIGIFKPERIEVVVPEDVDQETLAGYVHQGLSPVIVHRVGEGRVESEEVD